MPAIALWLASGCVPVLETPGGGVDSDWSWTAPENDWSHAEPPQGLEEGGFYEGDVAPDFRLVDQHGDEVALWQFYGNVVLLDLSTMWCAPCQELAGVAQTTSDDYADQGFVYVTILSQDFEGNPPDDEDLNAWADTFGIALPVLSDADAAYTSAAVPDAQYPGLFVVDREMKIAVRVATPSDANVREGIESTL
jgi:peroxiredoxin